MLSLVIPVYRNEESLPRLFRELETLAARLPDLLEVVFVVDGSPTLVVDASEHPLRPGSFARLDPEHVRTVRNDGETAAKVLIVSAPVSSGYEPLDWA
mgnify:CR=1 FL=1